MQFLVKKMLEEVELNPYGLYSKSDHGPESKSEARDKLVLASVMMEDESKPLLNFLSFPTPPHHPQC